LKATVAQLAKDRLKKKKRSNKTIINVPAYSPAPVAAVSNSQSEFYKNKLLQL